jgi:hypothetical protein
MARSCFGEDSSTFHGLFADMPSIKISFAFGNLFNGKAHNPRLIPVAMRREIPSDDLICE